jgi:pimeloyl-ACP methyl ester carboxylesterase
MATSTGRCTSPTTAARDKLVPLSYVCTGWPGHHVSWRDLAAFLVPHCRVLAIDLPVHGRTPRHGRSSAVLPNRYVLDRFLREVVGEPAVLVGTSMEASLAMLQAPAEPDSVSAMALLAPPMPRRSAELPSRAVAAHTALCSWPWLGPRRRRRRPAAVRAACAQQARAPAGGRAGRAEVLDPSCAVPARIAPETRTLAIDLVATRAAGDDVEAAFVEAARSVGVLVARATPYRRTIAAVRCPVVMIHLAERKGRTTQPDPAGRMGLPADLHQQR